MLSSMRTVIIALSFAILGCSIPGENDQLGFELGLADVLYEFRSGDRVLLGTNTCVRVAMARNAEGEPIRISNAEEEALYVLSCMDESLSGPAEFDADRCLQLDEPGELVWSLTPQPGCEWQADSLRIAVTAASPSLRLGFDDWRARAPEILTTATLLGLAPGRTVDDLREDPSAPRLVAADQLDLPLLRLDDELGRVWTTALPLAPLGEGATLITPVEDSLDYVQANELALVLDADAEVQVRATLPDGATLDSPPLVAVPTSSATSLDLVVLADVDYGYAFADVRDAEGRVIHAAPIEWSVVEGALRVIPGSISTDSRTAEYASISMSGCEPPPAQPTERRAVLRARLGELEDGVEVVWTAMPATPSIFDDLPFEPDPSCMFGDDVDDGGNDEVGEAGVDDGSGCACTSARDSSPLVSLPLLGLLALRRRRR
jgi:MYXO-CTERM domain-containing protein